jgi:O-antigen biosynthesis protein
VIGASVSVVQVPQVSVFTPSHRSEFLDDCYAAIAAQTFADWEWIVILNAGAVWTPPDDERVYLHRADALTGVGAVKHRACELAAGEILVECDHDDVLATTALAALVEAFATHPEVGFVYSDCAQMTRDGARDDTRFNPQHGWQYRETTVDGNDFLQCDALEPTPHNVSYIWYAPNHVRAFRSSAYHAAGGYDAKRDILDDQELMSRLYQQTEFLHLPVCLYLQRIHEGNTQTDAELNPRIQQETVSLYGRHIQPNALAWARRQGLHALDMGAAHRKQPGYLGLDQYARPGVDIVADVIKGVPLPDSSVGVIRAVDFLEHIPDKIAIFNELYRLLAHGGMLLSMTPSTDGRGAYQDPTHVAFYNENSFWYFTERQYADFVPQITCRFQASRVTTYFPSDWHRRHDIPYVEANLIAIKDGPRQGGFLLI